MTAIVRQGGTQFADSKDPHNIELFIDGEWTTTWHDRDLTFPWEHVSWINNILDKAFEGGEHSRSKEIRKLLGA